MKTIKVMETKWDIDSLYTNATTKSLRGLLGYMVKSGRTEDYVFGGAFSLLREIEDCRGIYRLKFENRDCKELVTIAEIAKSGGFRKFKISKRQIRRTLKMLKEMR